MGNENVTNNQLYELINQKFDTLVEKIEKNKEETNTIVCKLTEENRKLKEKVQYLENKTKKNNIAVFGLTETEEEHLLEDTLAQLNNKLNLEAEIKVTDVNNIYKPKHNKNKTPVIVEFTTYLKKLDVFKYINNLKNTGIFIAHDLSKEERIQNQLLRKKYKEAKSKNLEAKIKGKSLIVNGKVYSYSSLKAAEEEEEESLFEDLLENPESSAAGSAKPKESRRPILNNPRTLRKKP